MKKLFPSLLLAALILWPLGGGLHASAAGLTDHITVKSYDPNVDYLAAINRTAGHMPCRWGPSMNSSGT